MIGIVDYGCGNIQSLKNALTEIDVDFKIISTPSDIDDFSKIIIPGVGSYSNAMKKIKDRGFEKKIKDSISKKKNILGICVGMQILSTVGYEWGKHFGLDMIEGQVRLISDEKKISHVGWNNILIKNKTKLFDGIKNSTDFYFVHSFCFEVQNELEITSQVDFYNKRLTASLEKKNIYGVQFHPEKSLENGLKLLKNFSNI